jgi:hypothetical protein
MTRHTYTLFDVLAVAAMLLTAALGLAYGHLFWAAPRRYPTIAS